MRYLCYYVLMTKKMNKKINKLSRDGAVLLVVIALAILGGIFTMSLLMETKKTQNDKNWELIEKAQNEKDATICDEIQGGISELPKALIDRGVNAGFRTMDESEAKEYCRGEVAREASQ